MTFKLDHLHIKTPEPNKTAQYYVDHLGATIVEELQGIGYVLDLHGLKINMTTFVEDQSRAQSYGIEHIAFETDNVNRVASDLEASGATILESSVWEGGETYFLEGPDGVQLELFGSTASSEE